MLKQPWAAKGGAAAGKGFGGGLPMGKGLGGKGAGFGAVAAKGVGASKGVGKLDISVFQSVKGFYGGGKSFDKGKGKGKFDKGFGKGKKGKDKGPSGPNLPRSRITEEPVTGEVIAWKGKYGWIQPTTLI